MKIWVADELGQIKSCSLQESTAPEGGITLSETEFVSGGQDHNHSDYVQIMTHAKWDVEGKSMSGVAVARRGGVLQILDGTTGDVIWNRRDVRIEPEDMFVALEETCGHLFWCTNYGYFGFIALAEENIATGVSSSDPANPLPIEGLEVLKHDGPISKARCHPRFRGCFAYGGKDVNLEIWESMSEDLKSFRHCFTAKNVRNDEYGLEQPVWISDLRFLDEQRRSQNLGYLVAVCTRFHQIRVYDTSKSHRPIQSIETGSSPLGSMVLGKNDSEVICADSHGRVASFSLETGRQTGSFAGATGAVLSLDIHKVSSQWGILACVGLDRFLRIYDISTRASMAKVYCKTKMTSVLIVDGSLASPGRAPPTAKRKKLADSATRDDNENDPVWAKLPEAGNIGGSSIKRRRLRVPDSLPNLL